MSVFKRVYQWAVGLFRKEPEPEPKIEPVKMVGSWKLATLLDELPRFHRILKKCDKWRGTELGPVLRMGPTIISIDNSWLRKKPKKFKTLPAQFFVSWGSERENTEDNIQPKFFAGIKVDPPLTVQRFPGQCYKFLIYWDVVNSWISGHLWVDGDEIHLARERRKVWNEVTRNGKRPLRLPGILYTNPLVDFWRMEDETEFSAEEIIKVMFGAAMDWWAERNDRWLVITKKKYRRVSFSVEEGRHLYFFRDRDKTVTTPTGKRKTIFHIVSSHIRMLASGKETAVKEHCRGLRHFFWKGCECHIFAPGWHGLDFFADFEGTTHYQDEVPEDEWEEMTESTPVAEKAARMLEGTNVRGVQ